MKTLNGCISGNSDTNLPIHLTIRIEGVQKFLNERMCSVKRKSRLMSKFLVAARRQHFVVHPTRGFSTV